jgi:hypothetical protein
MALLISASVFIRPELICIFAEATAPLAAAARAGLASWKFLAQLLV